MEDVTMDDVAALVDDLEQSPWVEWGLWSEGPEGTQLRICGAEFDKADSTYLDQHAPPTTPAVQVQRALRLFLGR